MTFISNNFRHCCVHSFSHLTCIHLMCIQFHFHFQISYFSFIKAKHLRDLNKKNTYSSSIMQSDCQQVRRGRIWVTLTPNPRQPPPMHRAHARPSLPVTIYQIRPLLTYRQSDYMILLLYIMVKTLSVQSFHLITLTSQCINLFICNQYIT